MKTFPVSLSALGFAFVMLWGCGAPDPEGLQAVPEPQVHILRYDSLLFSIPQARFYQEAPRLFAQYPVPTEAYIQHVMGFPTTDSSILPRIQRLIYDRHSQTLFKDILTRYPSLRPLEKQLSDPIRRYMFYLKVDTPPHFFTYNSFFSYAVITYEGWVGIGLDMFLGKNYRYYPSTIRHRYLIRRREPAYILPNVMKALFTDRFPPDSFTDYTWMSRAIYEGKMLYFLDLTLPDVDDALKIEYQPAELEWVHDNERELWTFLVSEELLFHNKPKAITPFFNEAPFTTYSGIPSDAPPRLGQWVGWQIVRSYMERHPEVKPLDLFQDKDYRKIFQQSGYKPATRYF